MESCNNWQLWSCSLLQSWTMKEMHLFRLLIVVLISFVYAIHITLCQSSKIWYILLGETSAGKSSLLNLLMGENILPREVLSSTSCICQIFNSEEKKAVLIDENNRTIEINDVTRESLSKYLCVDRSNRKLQDYKSVDIYWPVPMLKVTRSLFITVKDLCFC